MTQGKDDRAPWALTETMFVGHYSVAFAARSERNEIPLWVLFHRSPISRLHLGNAGAAWNREAARDQRFYRRQHARLIFSSVLAQPYRSDRVVSACRSCLQATLRL